MRKESGYNTRALELVKSALIEGNGAHMTAEDIKKALLKRGEKIGAATVYRNLDKLLAQGLVRKYIGGDSACYSLVGENCHHHFHLKCSSCGKLIHLECEHVDKLSSHIADEHGFSIDKSKIVLYGLCRECAQ